MGRIQGLCGEGEGMTEAEWLACIDFSRLIDCEHVLGHDRKFRLFACACARRVWDQLPPSPIQQAVELAECFADGGAGLEELSQLHEALALDLHQGIWPRHHDTYSVGMAVTAEQGRSAAIRVCRPAASLAFPPGASNRTTAAAIERMVQVAVFRDIFPSPFARATLDLREPSVRGLALAIYEDRILPTGTFDPPSVLILSDALEEAGCTDDTLLSHLRSPGPHVRGCWALDLVLGKE